MEETKDFPITSVCYGLGIVLFVVAVFFDKPLDAVLAMLALVCILRVAADAFLEKLSWKTVAFRLMWVAAVATELAFFCDFFIGKIIFGSLFGIGAIISFWNFLVFMNTLPIHDDLDE